jgi:putative glutamine amidotransferase
MSEALRVAVSQRVDVWADRGERRDAIDQRLTAFLLAADLLPLLVPNGLESPARFAAWIQAARPHGIVLSGGNDIGEHPERDLTEGRLLEHGRERRLPVLGICRGMQMMAVHAGGRLKAVNGHVRARHRLQASGFPDDVNSFHRFSIDGCPPGYVVTARAEDGTVEAIRHEVLAWEGWMWHPERESSFSAADIGRLRTLFRTEAPQ